MRRPLLRDFVRIGAHEFGVPVDHMYMSHQNKTVRRAKCAVAYLAVVEFKFPNNQVAVHFGRDHTTIISSVARGRELARVDPLFDNHLNRMREKLLELMEVEIQQRTAMLKAMISAPPAPRRAVDFLDQIKKYRAIGWSKDAIARYLQVPADEVAPIVGVQIYKREA